MANLKHVVMFSGGVGSWATAKRVADLYGTKDLTLLFADVGGKHTSPHAGEDEDCYRFIDDAHKNVGGELVTLNEGRDIWEVFKDDRFLGNSRLANCSKFLKQKPCREWLEANCDPENTAVYVGIDWTETHRIPAIENAYLPYLAFCPMTEPPYLSKDDVLDWCRSEGLEPPRMYAQNYPHANCLAPDTRYITSEGVKTLKETCGETVQVLGRSGGWREARIECFGVQQLSAIELSRYADSKLVEATADHLWPVRKAAGRSDYAWKKTSELRNGDCIAGMYGSVRHNVTPSAIGVAAGFTFGDGTVGTNRNQVSPGRAFICGEKDKALLPYFSSCRMSRRADGVIEVLDLPRSWKGAPDLGESQSYLYGWLAGYFAADGTYSKGSARISSASRDNLEIVRDVCARIGIATRPIRVEMRKGYGDEPTPLYTVALIQGTLREDFFIIDEHRLRFAEPRPRVRPADWRVTAVAHDIGESEVMCAVVPDGHMFTLEDNLLTHNCGGGCVRAGQGQFKLLYEVNPERFAYWEQKEAEMRDFLGKDVAILRSRKGGVSKPLPLSVLRKQIEGEPDSIDTDDIGGCGCFVD